MDSANFEALVRFPHAGDYHMAHLTEEALGGLRADVALVSNSAIHDLAACHQDGEVVGIKRRRLRSSTKVYLMADHAKSGRNTLHVFAGLDAFDGVVTGPGLSPAILHDLRDGGVTLHMAEEETQ